ncbi:RusA family crossover junction endodeoxyribonuclease [Xanthomonas citri pv. citri]
MKIVVYGDPAPQGSKSFKGTFTGKDGRTHAKLAESSKRVAPWRQDVKMAAEAEIEGRGDPAAWVPMDGPLLLLVVFTLPAPLSLPKRRASYPCKLPDLSKLVRSTEDALTAAGVWKDDARVVECRAIKTYPADTLGAHPEALRRPGAVIVVLPYTG